MRRGLKRLVPIPERMRSLCFKPIPDEEGTETAQPGRDCAQQHGFKPIPDEEGTETMATGCELPWLLGGFKPIPDEEGTETRGHPARRHRHRAGGFKPIPDEEGTETYR